jgi:hypothetical protein
VECRNESQARLTKFEILRSGNGEGETGDAFHKPNCRLNNQSLFIHSKPMVDEEFWIFRSRRFGFVSRFTPLPNDVNE